MNIDTYLNQEQQDYIINTIIDRCELYREWESKIDALSYAPYLHGRDKYPLTGFVYSGFSPKFLNIEGMETKDISYGLNDNLSQPELKSANAYFHIYSSSSKCEAKVTKEMCKKHNTDLTTLPIFLLIIFDTDKDKKLNEIVVKCPDANGKTIDSYTLFPDGHKMTNYNQIADSITNLL